MSSLETDAPLFDYKLYRFGELQQAFRGPVPDLYGGYVAFLGSTATFGRYVHRPFADLVADLAEVETANLGTDGVGPGFFLQDAELSHVASGAAVCVVEAMSADWISNRMYTVRPRRNGRLHAVSELLQGIYPEVDFEQRPFVRGLLAELHQTDPQRFRLIENEIKNAWIGRMMTLLKGIRTRTILLWLSEREPGEAVWENEENGLLKYPHFVDEGMIEAVREAADGYVECVGSAGLPQDLTDNGEPVLFRPSGQPILANRTYPSPHMHERAAMALLPEIQRLLRA